MEDVDRMLENFSKETETVLNVTQSMLQHRNFNYGIQLILVGESWSMNLEKLIRKLESLPLVCIGTHLEAALYGRVDIQMHFITMVLKKSKIAGISK